MKLIQSKSVDINYLSKVVNIKEFKPHSNPEVTRLKCCIVDGFNIITGIDAEPGFYVYFPALSCINSSFLSYANLYRDKQMNRDPEQSGMFENNGRVKAIKLKGEISEGFIIPLQVLKDYILYTTSKELLYVEENTEFDSVEDNGKEFWISKKYIPNIQYNRHCSTSKITKKIKASLDRVRPDQFRLHYDTVVIRKCPYVIHPNDLIHVSSKMHGCVDAKTLINTSKGIFTIKEIVDNRLDVEIEAYDITQNKRVFVPIDDYYMIQDDGEWYEIELENGTKLTITGNNPVWLPELNCYRKVEELKEGDSVLVSD